MDTSPLYPLQFEPILKRLLWGGRRLGTILGKSIGPETDYAESWEVADHRDDISVVRSGPLAGQPLRDLVKLRGGELMGPMFGSHRQFPLLVKFLDAHQHLSVQVHPDDLKGKILADDNGKTETWIILHAEPGSLIYSGLQPGVDRSRFAEAMRSGEVEPLLHRFEPKTGDCVMIPAGTVHAIGAGIMLAEIQQMSDATFRVHDWGRVDAQGKPRDLHLEQALEAIDFAAGPVNPLPSAPETVEGATRERLSECEYFAVERWTLNGTARIGSPERFTLVIGLRGQAEISHHGTTYDIATGQTCLLPASIGACDVRPLGEATLLTCVVP